MIQPVDVVAEKRCGDGGNDGCGPAQPGAQNRRPDAGREDESMRDELEVPPQRAIGNREHEPVERIEQQGLALPPQGPAGAVEAVPQRQLSVCEGFPLDMRYGTNA